MESGEAGQRPPDGGPADPSQDVESAPPRPFSPRRAGKRRAAAAPETEPGPQLWPSGVLQDLIEDLTEQIAVVDASWRILAVNKSWNQSLDVAAAAGECLPLRVGDNYLDFAQFSAGRGSKEGLIIAEALKQISAGTRTTFHHLYVKPGAGKDPEYRLIVSSFTSGGARFATIARYEVTELVALTRQYRRLERSMVRVQEEERRRIGRELHDSTAQLLVALQLSMIRLKAMHRDEASGAVFGEIDDTLERVNEEIRAISFLLHPPALEDGGLVETLDAMARGFARRTNLRINFWFDGEEMTWEPMVEVTLYRLAQEALANVHRHARANRVGMRLVATRRGYLHLVIEDDGIGISIHSSLTSGQLGVGIAGMRARIAELGGRLAIRRMDSGTCIIASVPLAPRRPRPVDLIASPTSRTASSGSLRLR